MPAVAMGRGGGQLLFDLDHGREWRITNIKSRFKVKCGELRQLILSRIDPMFIKERRNIISFRTEVCTFIAFCTTGHGHINVSGVRSVEANEKAVNKFFEIFPECRQESCVIIDNISATGSLRSYLGQNFTSIVSDLSCLLSSSPSFDPFSFPSANIKTEYGCISLFESGAMNITGLKNIDDAAIFRNAIRELLTLC